MLNILVDFLLQWGERGKQRIKTRLRNKEQVVKVTLHIHEKKLGAGGESDSTYIHKKNTGQ